MIRHDRGELFFGLILPHGLLELTAVFVAAGVGLRLFWAWVRPAGDTRARSLAAEGRSAGGVALGLVVVLLVSGVIEGFVTPSGLPTWARVAIGIARRGAVPGVRLRPRPVVRSAPAGPATSTRPCWRTGSRRPGRAGLTAPGSRRALGRACGFARARKQHRNRPNRVRFRDKMRVTASGHRRVPPGNRICELSGFARVPEPRQLACGFPGAARTLEQPPRLERQVVVGQAHRQVVGVRVEDVDAERGEQPGGAVALARCLLGGRRVRTSPRASRAAAASRSISGSRTDASSTRCRAVSGPSSGSSPCSMAEGSSAVSSTTSARCRPSESTAPTSAAPVGLGEHRLRGRPSRPGGSRQPSLRWRPLERAAHAEVAGDEVDPVAGARRQRGEQQGGVHRRVQPRDVVDPAGRGAPGVQDEHHPAVALGLPGAHHHVVGCARWPASRCCGRRRRGRTPAASRTPCPARAPAPRTDRRARAAGRAGWAGARDGNAGSTRTVPGASSAPCRPARPSGPRRAHRDPVGLQVAAPGRAQRGA